ncbi:MAG: DUF6279 family lipoprotein, partial [Burkholderiales bacterium]|nr:DUF6279 family lipoprotein [Burkholderiales bacterium]
MSCFFKGKWIGIISLLLAGILLSGCTSLKLAYNQGEHLGVWWLNGYVDLDKTQAQQVREDLRALQRIQRQQQLPIYADWLQQLQGQAAQDTTPEQVCAAGQQLRSFAMALVSSTEGAATTLAQSLNPAQLQHLERKFADKNADYRKEWLSLEPAELQAKRLDTLLERAETVYGRMDTAQKALLRQQSEQSLFDPQRTHAERLRRPLARLQTHLEGTDFLVGGRFTAADINTAECVRYAQGHPTLVG